MSNIDVVRKNLGHVTAYKYAVSKGFQGTEEEFAELMASYASIAQDVSAESRVAEGYALGKQNGVDVGDQSPYYHANAKYHAEQAAASASAAAESARTLTIDPTLTHSGQAADAKKTGDELNSLKNEIEEHNSIDFLLSYGDHPSGERNGITWTWDSTNKNCTVTGTATGVSTSRFYGSETTLPEWIKPGETYYLKYNATGDAPALCVIIRDENGGALFERYIRTNFTLSIPENAVGIILRLQVNANVSVNGTVSVKLFRGLPNNELSMDVSTNATSINTINSQIQTIQGEQAAQNTALKSAIDINDNLLTIVGQFLTNRGFVFQPSITNEYIDDNGNITQSTIMYLTGYIKIPSGKKMFVSFGGFNGGNDCGLRAAYYSSKDGSAFISRILIDSHINETNFTNIVVDASSMANAEYVRFCYETRLNGIVIVEQQIVTLKESDDLNDLLLGCYGYASGNAPTNWPISHDKTSGLYGILYHITINSIALQTVMDYHNNLYIRRRSADGQWTSWTQYAKHDDLLPINLSSIDNIDDITKYGVYATTGIPTNWPISHDKTSGLYGMLYHITINSIALQMVMDYHNNLYIRRRSADGQWTSWTQYAKYMPRNSALPLAAKTFKRVGCIGDSYTEGYIRTDSQPAVHLPEYSWPHYMETLTGNVWTNFGVSGSSVKTWMARGSYSKLSEVEAQGNKCQAYVIGLMINDSNPDGDHYVELGTADDIGTSADSYYAYYYKLIQAINTVNSDAPIFCNTCPRTENRFVAYNTAVRDIVEYCRNNSMPVYLCDLAGTEYNNDAFYKNLVFTSDYSYGHYTAIGYEMMAECYLRVLSDVMIKYNSEMKNIYRIPYDALT